MISACRGSVSWNSSTKTWSKSPCISRPDLEVRREEVAEHEEQVDLVHGAVAGLHLAVEGDDGGEGTDETGREPALGRAHDVVDDAGHPLLHPLTGLLVAGPGRQAS